MFLDSGGVQVLNAEHLAQIIFSADLNVSSSLLQSCLDTDQTVINVQRTNLAIALWKQI